MHLQFRCNFPRDQRLIVIYGHTRGYPIQLTVDNVDTGILLVYYLQFTSSIPVRPKGGISSLHEGTWIPHTVDCG